MAVIEKLLTMGLAQGTDPRRMLLGALGLASGPASDRLDWTDIRFAMGTLVPKHRAILQLRATPELVTANELAALVNHLCKRLIRFESTPTPDKSAYHPPTERSVYKANHKRQSAIIRIALAEYQDPKVCRTCRGAGKIAKYTEGKGVEAVGCERCAGNGWVRWSDNYRARAVGGDRNAWVSRYAPSYDHTLRSCTSLYLESSRLFKAVLLGKAEDPTTPCAIESKLQARC